MPLFPNPFPSLIPYNLASSIQRATMNVNGAINDITSMLGLDLSSGFSSAFNLDFSSGAKTYPKDFCFIKVMDNKNKELDTIRFQFMPKTISDIKSANYNDIQIIGRSSPFKSYANSGARGLAFALDFFANPESGSADMTPKKIKAYIDRLQALVHPIYSNYTVAPPPRCIVSIGQQIPSVVCVCKSVNVTYNNQINPWTSQRQAGGFYAFGATVQLAFEEVQEIPLGYFNVTPSGTEGFSTGINAKDFANIVNGGPLSGPSPLGTSLDPKAGAAAAFAPSPPSFSLGLQSTAIKSPFGT